MKLTDYNHFRFSVSILQLNSYCQDFVIFQNVDVTAHGDKNTPLKFPYDALFPSFQHGKTELLLQEK